MIPYELFVLFVVAAITMVLVDRAIFLRSFDKQIDRDTQCTIAQAKQYSIALDVAQRRADHYKERCRKLRNELFEIRELLDSLTGCATVDSDDASS